VDIWALGTIFAQIIFKNSSVMFVNDINPLNIFGNQIEYITQTLGTSDLLSYISKQSIELPESLEYLESLEYPKI